MEEKKYEHPAVKFFKSLYEYCEEALLDIRYLPKVKDSKDYPQSKFLPISEVESLPETLKKLQGRYNCYFGVATRTEDAKTKKDQSKEGIHQFPALWVDIDFKDILKEEVLKRLKDFQLKPSFRVCSGNGFHLYWKLKEPIAKEKTPEVENLNKRLASFLGGDFGSTEAAHILRIPTTLNHKYDPPREVTLEEFCPERECDLCDFDLLPEVETLTEKEKIRSSKGWQEELLAGVKEGERNRAIARLAGRYLQLDLSRNEILPILLDANSRFDPPLDKEEVETTLDNIIKTDQRNYSRGKKEGDRAGTFSDGGPYHDPSDSIDKSTAQIKFPEDAWIGLFDGYRELMKDATEAPEAFHFGVLLVILGFYFGKDFYIKNPHTTYFNFYSLLVGATGESYKTTALKYGKRILQDLSLRGGDSVKIIGTPVSAEGLVTSFDAENGTKVLSYIDEMKILFGNAQRNSTSNLIATINQFYSEYEEISLPGLQKRVAKKPFLSIIGGTVSEWLDNALSKEVTLGGFINRFIVLSGETRKIIPRPNDPAQDRWGKFIQEIIAIRKNLPKEGCLVTRSNEAEKFYGQWYGERKTKRKNLLNVVRPLTAREPAHVDKLAGIFSLIDGRTVIGPEDIAAAIKVIEYSSSWMEKIFRDVTIPRIARLDQLIFRYHEDGPREKRWVQQRIGGNYSCEELNRSYRSLCEADSLELVTIPKEGKEVKMYRVKV